MLYLKGKMEIYAEVFMEQDGFFDVSDLLRSGIYALTWRGEVVYVGQTVRLFQRLYAHAMGRLKRKVTMGRKTIKGSTFDGILILPCAESDLDRLEAEFIQKYQPRYNVVGKKIVAIPEDIKALLVTIAPELPSSRDSFQVAGGHFIPRRL